jgi:hypothetical protein
MIELVRGLAPSRFVLDGELAIPEGASLSFDALQMRLHPAESRIRKLARETPAGSESLPIWVRTASLVRPAGYRPDAPSIGAKSSGSRKSASPLSSPVIGCGHRLDQRGIFVVDVPDPLVDRPDDHVLGGIWSQK